MAVATYCKLLYQNFHGVTSKITKLSVYLLSRSIIERRTSRKREW